MKPAAKFGPIIFIFIFTLLFIAGSVTFVFTLAGPDASLAVRILGVIGSVFLLLNMPVFLIAGAEAPMLPVALLGGIFYAVILYYLWRFLNSSGRPVTQTDVLRCAGSVAAIVLMLLLLKVIN